MESRDENTSFKQFKYCPLCRYNHKKGKKHIYSKHHQTILTNVMKKFSVKIQRAKETLFAPLVEDCSFENGAKFWCYFCATELPKHTVLEDCTVLGGGILEHITSVEHKSNMEQFFWDNLLKKDSKPQFVLSLEDLCIFKKAAFLAVKKRQKSVNLERKRLAAELQLSTERREARLVEVLQSEGSISSIDFPGNWGTSQQFQQRIAQETQPGTRQEVQLGTSRKRTASAKADGLACISVVDSDAGAGNVHSGATPPWLQSDDNSYTREEIGPTLEDFNKHLQQEKRAKLPACRVGAKFDHSATLSEDWLPSFGRVWGTGRRLQSKQHFEKNWKKIKSGSTSRSSHTATSSNSANETLGRNKLTTNTSTSYDDSLSPEKDSSRQECVTSNGLNLMNHLTPYKRKKAETQTSVITNMRQTTVLNDAPCRNDPTRSSPLSYKRQNLSTSSSKNSNKNQYGYSRSCERSVGSIQGDERLSVGSFRGDERPSVGSFRSDERTSVGRFGGDDRPSVRSLQGAQSHVGSTQHDDIPVVSYKRQKRDSSGNS